MLIPVLIVIVALGFFFYTPSKTAPNPVPKEPVVTKYSILINHILSYSSDLKIDWIINDSILISQKIAGVGNVTYTIHRFFGKVRIKYTYSIYGTSPMEFKWDYQEDFGQQLIIDDINKSIVTISKKLINKS